MTDAAQALRTDVASAARAFAKLGFVHAFGHVSARSALGLLITPTTPPLAIQSAQDILEVDFNGRVLSGEALARPIEAFLHIAVYRARPDVAAICRTHAPNASVWRDEKQAPTIRHGFGGIAATVGFHDEADLVHDPELGARAARSLARRDALVLRGNGVLTVGASLGEAAARMWSLEERYLAAARLPANFAPFSEADLAARGRWYSAESKRIWTWLKYLASDGPDARSAASAERKPLGSGLQGQAQ